MMPPEKSCCHRKKSHRRGKVCVEGIKGRADKNILCNRNHVLHFCSANEMKNQLLMLRRPCMLHQMQYHALSAKRIITTLSKEYS